MAATTLNLTVHGMKCQKCVARVGEILHRHPRVADCHVSLEEAQAQITLVDEQADCLDELRSELEDAGFSTTAAAEGDAEMTARPRPHQPEDSRNLRFAVGGMSCASCAATIERRLQSLAGIEQAVVNLAGNFARVSYQPELVTPEQIHRQVEKAGFRVLNQAPGEDGDDPTAELRLVGIAAAGALPIMLLMFYPLFGPATQWLNAVLATLVQFTAGLGFYRSAWAALKNASPNMDVLVALGISAAYGYSLLAVTGLLGADATVFFETGAMLILFIRFGKWLEARAKGRASAALTKLLELRPETAVRYRQGEEQQVPIGELRVNDLVLVRPGERIPVDGVVVEGAAAVNEAMMTGEAVPVDKSVGSQVIGATLNQSGRLVVQATQLGDDSVLARIVELVADAQGDKAPIQRLADRVASYFVPAVIGLSLLTFMAWYLWVGESFLLAFQMAIAVVVIACPCALGLATPTAIMVGSSVGLEQGILFKKASVLENMSRLDLLLLDKTGTLTSGSFQLEQIVPVADITEDELLALAAALEQGSNHPLARSLVKAANSRGLELQAVDQLEESGGRGVRGTLAGQTLLCGNRILLVDQGVDLGPAEDLLGELDEQGKTLILLARDTRLLGVFTLADGLREEAVGVVERLKEMDIVPVLLTGDRRQAARAVAAQLGLDRVEAEVLPADKLAVVKKYQQQGYQVGMVGDGINDAPALAQADIGIAIGSGSDVAKETGDLVLVGDDLNDIVRSIRLGRATLSKIKQNLGWAFIYNLLALPLAAGLFYPLYGLYLKPEYAGLAMAFSSVSVVTNSLLLRRIGPRLRCIGRA